MLKLDLLGQIYLNGVPEEKIDEIYQTKIGGLFSEDNLKRAMEDKNTVRMVELLNREAIKAGNTPQALIAGLWNTLNPFFKVEITEEAVTVEAEVIPTTENAIEAVYQEFSKKVATTPGLKIIGKIDLPEEKPNPFREVHKHDPNRKTIPYKNDDGITIVGAKKPNPNFQERKASKKELQNLQNKFRRR
jgi:hypothetical protein